LKFAKNSEDFNKEKIQILLNKETVKTIYINLGKKYKDLSKELINIIIKYFTENPLNNNPSDLIDVIKNSKEFRLGLFKNMDKYIITEDELYQKEDSDNFKLLEGLIKEGFFNFDNNKDNNNKDDENNIRSSEYIVRSSSVIKKIINNIKKNNIKYSKINYIYENNLEKIFYKRLSILFQLYNEEIKTYESEVQKSYSETKKNFQLFEIFLNDFSFFYPEKHKKEIIELHDAIRKINNEEISNYINKDSKMHIDYMNKYKVEVYERKNFLRSLFFRSIYKKTKILIKDEDNCLQETKEKINNLKHIFDKGIKESNLKTLESCLKAFKGKNINEELNKEIEILEKILGINYKYDKNKLFENLNNNYKNIEKEIAIINNNNEENKKNILNKIKEQINTIQKINYNNIKYYKNKFVKNIIITEEYIYQILKKDLIDFMNLVKYKISIIKPKVNELINFIQNSVEKSIGNEYEVKLYGSHATGLCLPWSDIDVVLCKKNENAIQNENNSYSNKFMVLHDLFTYLQKNNDFKSINYIGATSVPLIKIKTKENIDIKNVDISLQDNTHYGIKCVTLVLNYIKEYEALLPMVLALKNILKQANLNDPYTVSTNIFI
jgi:hypothetical protein